MALKHGLDINELTSGSGTEIEIDTEAESLAAAGEEEDGREPKDEQFDKKEVYKQISLEPILGSRDDSSGSESDDGLV